MIGTTSLKGGSSGAADGNDGLVSPWFTGRIGSRYWPCGKVGSQGMGTSNPAIDVLMAHPFIVPRIRPATFNRIAFMVSGAGAAGSVARVGIYSNVAGDLYPDALVVDGGQYDATVTGEKITVVADFVLTAGATYWAAYHCGVAAPTIRILDSADFLPLLGHTAGNLHITCQHITLARAYGALPATFPAGAGAVSLTNTRMAVLVASL